MPSGNFWENPLPLTTSWTLVFQATDRENYTNNRALGQLLERYWQPLYFFARRQGLSADDAEDATQTFLMELIEGNCLADADPAKGRFRTYLLMLWKRFLIDRVRYENRLKRGGGVVVTSLFCVEAERAWLDWSTSSTPNVDPDRAYYERWAATILEASMQSLQTEYKQSGRESICATLVPYLTVPVQAADYREMALRLKCSEGAAKVALHRLRQRFAQALRWQVQETLDDPNDLQAELDELIRYIA